MGYKLVFAEVTEGERKSAEENHVWLQEAIEITPPLADAVMEAIEPMIGQTGSCREHGAQVISVSESRIIIASCCKWCRLTLIWQIISSLGRKITVCVE